MYFAIKTLLTALLIAGISELSRRFSFIAALLISLPLMSIFTFCWIYYESGDVHKIAVMSHSVFWLVIPSLLLFLVLPICIRIGMPFMLAMLLSCAITAAAYMVAVWLLRLFSS